MSDFNGRAYDTPDDHVASCQECGAALALLGTGDPAAQPPPRLRDAVLSKARRTRQEAAAQVAALAVPYAAQVALMEELLDGLSHDQWEAPVVKHGTVRGMIGHLAENDARAAHFMGVSTALPERAETRWRRQATGLLERVSVNAEPLLAVEMALAGRRPVRGTLRQALIQRTFETWTHADDIRTALGRPSAVPPGETLNLIASFGLALLPKAMPRRDVVATVVLTGPGGGSWTLPLSPAPTRPGVLVSANVVDFCRLLAGRWSPDTFPYAAEGDPALARELIAAASTLGCD
ncbi:hypothetical protein ACIBG8_53170 [Nonomuraea sp. NPDC050556]|uniref:hypothetical protein n=1 Tax=Nonomuraea sp. NPDC050556 TaxID=3364369 RepID=UPI0037BBFB23